MSSYIFNKQKWQQQDVFYQLGNIGSEVGRTVNALSADRKQDSEAAFYRGIDLIDATLAAPSFNSVGRKQELGRAREQFVQVYNENDLVLGRSLENYFMQFAVAARMRQLP